MGFYSPASLVHDARRHGVVVLGPCMRDGGWECDLVEVAAPPGGARAEHALGSGADAPGHRPPAWAPGSALGTAAPAAPLEGAGCPPGADPLAGSAASSAGA